MKQLFLIGAMIGISCFIIQKVHAHSRPQPSEPNKVCSEAWHNDQKANVLWKTGWGLFGVGTGLAAIGGTLGWISGFGASALPPEEKSSKETDAVPIIGWTLCGVGSGAVVASIPCLAIGQVRRKATLKTYNKNSVIEPSLTFYVKTSSDGLGIAMQF